MSDSSDLLGNAMTDAEQKLVSAYRMLESLQDEELSPSARANVAEAIAALWQAVNNLALIDDRPSA